MWTADVEAPWVDDSKHKSLATRQPIVYLVHRVVDYNMNRAASSSSLVAGPRDQRCSVNSNPPSIIDRLHPHRTARGHCHNWRTGGALASRGSVRSRGGKSGQVPEQPQAAWSGRPSSITIRTTPFPRAGTARPRLTMRTATCSPTSTARRPATPYQTYMWGLLPSLFGKLEQTNLFNELNLLLPPTNIENSTAIRRTLDMFVCPSNRRPETTTQTGSTQKIGPSDYRGNMAGGMVLPDARLELPHPRPDQSILLSCTIMA